LSGQKPTAPRAVSRSIAWRRGSAGHAKIGPWTPQENLIIQEPPRQRRGFARENVCIPCGCRRMQGRVEEGGRARTSPSQPSPQAGEGDLSLAELPGESSRKKPDSTSGFT
jgi:hypothetical protein